MRDFGDKAIQCHTAIQGCDAKLLAVALRFQAVISGPKTVCFREFRRFGFVNAKLLASAILDG